MSILSAWRNRDLAAFEDALKTDKSEITALHASEGYSTILESIAQTIEPESRGFVDALIGAGVDLDQINATTGKSAVHLAAEKLNFPVLEALLSANADINQTELKDSNSLLHILAKKVAPNLSQQHEKCLDLVLNSPDLYLNHANKKNLTPVLTAYEQGAWRVMLKLLKAGAVVENLDYKTDGKKSLREEIQERCPEILHELPSVDFEYTAPQGEIKLLKKYLNASSEERFCYEFNIFMADIRKRGSEQIQKDCLKLLNSAIIRQLPKATGLLLKFIKQNFSNDSKKALSNALVQASKTGNPKIVTQILDEDPEDIEASLFALIEENPFTKNHETCFKEIARKSAISNPGNHGETLLHLAAKYENATAMEILLENGANIFVSNEYGQHCYELIPREILEKFLDGKIEKDVNGSSYYFDVDFLSNEKMSAISRLADSNRSHLITHPVIESFITEKWQKFSPIFYAGIFFATLFNTILLFFIIETLSNGTVAAVRIILIISLTIFTAYLALFPVKLNSLLRSDNWLDFILIFFVTGALMLTSQWLNLITGMSAAIHHFSKISPLHITNPVYIFSREILKTSLTTFSPYIFALFLTETARIFHPDSSQIFFIILAILLTIFLAHFFATAVENGQKIYQKKNYYLLKTRINFLTDYEERFLIIPRIRHQYLTQFITLPKLPKLLKFPTTDRLRLNLNNGNTLETFTLRKKSTWWEKSPRLPLKTVERISEIFRKRLTHKPEKKPEDSPFSVLVSKTDHLSDRIRNYSTVLEKLELKSRDMENLLIQIMRVNSLRDEN